MRFSIQICLVWAIGGVLMMFAQGKKLVSSGQWRDPYYDVKRQRNCDGQKYRVVNKVYACPSTLFCLPARLIA